MNSLGLSILLVGAGITNGVGQIMMRAGGRDAGSGELITLKGAFAHPMWSLGLIVCWVCGLFWAWLVPRLPLMTAVPVYVGICFITVAVGSVAALGEPMRIKEGLGALLVIAGITLLARR